MVNGVASKPRQNVALGQGVSGGATQAAAAFTFCIYRGLPTVGNTLVLAGLDHEFDNNLRGKDNPAIVGESDFTEPNFESCMHEQQFGKKYEYVL